MKRWILLSFSVMAAVFLSACTAFPLGGFPAEGLRELWDQMEKIAEDLGEIQLSCDEELIGIRTAGEDSYTGSYSYESGWEEKTLPERKKEPAEEKAAAVDGRDVVFGGASLHGRSIRLSGKIRTISGSAAVRIRQNWEVTILTPREDGTFEICLDLESGGNYIMVDYENFCGQILLEAVKSEEDR